MGERGSAVDGPGPKRKPPESRLPCFLDIEPSRRRVLAVEDAKVVVRGEVVRAGGRTEDSAEVDRWPMGNVSGRFGFDRPWPLNPFQPSPFQPFIAERGAGSAETGRIFFLLGVRSSSSVSVSSSLSSLVRPAGKEVECGRGGGENGDVVDSR